MRRQERQHLESEVALLVDLLRQTPEDAVVDRVNLEDRLAEVREALASAGAPEPEATRFALTFSGEPVEGSHAIEAQFAGRAVALFSEAVSLTAASFSDQTLQSSGPIPGDKERRLRIVGPALGSFGFELELPPKQPGLFPDFGDPEEDGLLITFKLLESALEGDAEGLSDNLSAIELRAARKLGEFVKLTADRHALFALRLPGRRLAAVDHEAARRAATMLRAEGAEQETVTFGATLTGLRPSKPDFECVRAEDGVTILGAVDRSANIDELKSQLDKPATLRFRRTSVPSRRPRFALLGVASED